MVLRSLLVGKVGGWVGEGRVRLQSTLVLGLSPLETDPDLLVDPAMVGLCQLFLFVLARSFLCVYIWRGSRRVWTGARRRRAENVQVLEEWSGVYWHELRHLCCQHARVDLLV